MRHSYIFGNWRLPSCTSVPQQRGSISVWRVWLHRMPCVDVHFGHEQNERNGSVFLFFTYIYISFLWKCVYNKLWIWRVGLCKEHFVEHAEKNIVISTWTSGKSLGQQRYRNSRLETLERSGSRLHEARQTPVWTTWWRSSTSPMHRKNALVAVDLPSSS